MRVEINVQGTTDKKVIRWFPLRNRSLHSFVLQMVSHKRGHKIFHGALVSIVSLSVRSFMALNTIDFKNISHKIEFALFFVLKILMITRAR